MAAVDLGQRCEKVACLDMPVPRLDEPALRLPARLAAGLPYDLVQLGRSDAKRLGGLFAHAPIVELVERRELGDYVFVLGAVASHVFVLNWRGRPRPTIFRLADDVRYGSAIGRRPIRKIGDKLVEAIDASSASVEPVRYIAAFRDLRPELLEVEHAHTLGDAVKVPGDRLDMVAPDIIVIAADHDVGVAEMLIEVLSPLARAHGVCRGGDAEVAQRVHVLLALDDEDHVFQRNVLNQFGQAERNKPHAFDGPFLLVWSGALTECLAATLQAQRLK